MIKRRPQTRPDKGSPKWMVTFSDLMTLILVFFILLFSMSVVDANKFRAISDSFQERSVFDFNPSIIPFENPAPDTEPGDDPFEQDDPFESFLEGESDESEGQLDQFLEEVIEFLDSQDLLDAITASRDDRGVVLVLQEQVLFESAEADVIPDAVPFLDKVGTLLESVPNIVKVEGHTDSRPISTHRYPSNWELSGARASSVIRYLVDQHNLDPERFISVGYGETKPVVPNTSEQNFQQNRRVVIVISDPAMGEEDLF
ncbi:flagellar motor protein MotS [Evansella clarkii]|uniref:flagellar motor protein MotS n=1 Tax=Evansella clarkii TaxID=79879 RepID=UPI0009960800|nr:flagellar motor protein MotS [Evansella clarkii]